ncbi:uncharacterized protein PHACADRAFT_257086, partial [Phanerochaete carnosa HHB-10118-sp]
MKIVDNSPEHGDISCVFPREIVDIIIDHLGQLETRGVLQKCCLVCRAWALRVRLHLFRRVEIRVKGLDNDCDDFQEQLENTLCEFSAFLSRAPPPPFS